MTFNPHREPVDYIELSGQRSPGIAIVEGAGSPREWQERRGFAMSGAYSVFRGVKLRHFKVKFVLCTEQEFDEWHAFRRLLARPRPGVRRVLGMDIVHPILADLDIVSAQVEDESQPVPDGLGTWTVEVAFIEYRRPTYSLASGEGSSTTTTDDPYDRRIEQMVAQAQRLAGEGSP